ncbi:hydantoinase/carbamoylase family amidase [Bordetella muralis]|jgi:beta-ureidopropionase / N-carbamoyl-L-amino-acid hydrolase|uniref:hydantoinase/carbamoylase family amidase n=1 Tax=Bordetella muralis TaxID=1649130 RepID=UPI0039EFA551
MTISRTSSLLRDLAQTILAEIREATRDGLGVTRESYGAGEEAALRILESHAERLGLAYERDGAQNLWMWLPQDQRPDPFVTIGSHVDSVPQGGNFDGLAGVVCGMLVLSSLRGHHEDAPPVRVLALRGEESAWYGKAYMGSLALLGRLPASALNMPHRGGQGTLGDAMARCGVDIEAVRRAEPMIDPARMGAYLELHIEQGPVMVARQWPVAAVTGIRGNIRHNHVRCIGETGHSGAVPRWLRKDALLAVAELLSRMDEHWRVLLQMGMDLVMTSGICSTPQQSHAVSVIPGEVQLSFEVRSQDTQTLERFYTLMRDECRAIEASRGVRFEFDERLFTEPATMDPAWIAKLESAAAQTGMALERIPSGAGHDASVFANAGIPSAMVFIRNANGSHNPHEAMDIEDFLLGTDLLHRALNGTIPPRQPTSVTN